MFRFPRAYRLFTLTFALAFALGITWTGMCSNSAGATTPKGYDHAQEFCAALCHVAKTPPEVTLMPVVVADPGQTGPGATTVGEIFESTRTSLLQFYAAACSDGIVGLEWLPVRLHLFHAVFLN
jgi:hypothetical protein